MPDWSKIGRKSRVKGKVYERDIAAMLREITGLDWQTTRNSGRTDLKGDVYCLNATSTAVIECKDRVGFQPLCMLQGNCSYVDEIENVRQELKRVLGCQYAKVVKVVFSKVRLTGDLIGVLDGDVDAFLNPLAKRAGILAADGTKYRLLRGLPLQSAECERLFGVSCPGLPVR
jgi:hypothetical protein